MASAAWRESRLRKAGLSLKGYARHSALVRFGRFWARQYASSSFKKKWEGWLGAPQRAGYSARLYRFMEWCGLRTRSLGRTLAPAWEHSLPARGLRGARASRVWRGSLPGRLLSRLRWSDWLLVLFCLYLPADYALRSWAPPAVATYWDEVFLLAAALCLVFWKMSPSAPLCPCTTPLDAPLFFFFALGILLLGVVSPILRVAIDGYRAVYQYMLWFFLVARLVRDRRAVRICYTLFVVMGALIGLHGIYQYVTGAQIPSSWVSIHELGVRTRAFSILGSPNIMGCVMVMLAPLAAGLAYAVKSSGTKLLCWGAAGVMCLGCLFSFSRGAWLGLAVAIIVFALLRDRKLLILAGLALAALVMLPEIANRITFLFTSDFASNNATGGRGIRWETGLNLLHSNNPVFGFGLGRFGGAVAMQNQTVEKLRYFYMDNYYLKTLVEMGYLGLAGYLLLLASLVWNGMRTLFRTRAHKTDYSLACGLFAGLAGVLTHCYFENIFEVPYMNAYFWGLAALLMVLGFRITPDTAAGSGARISAGG